VFVDAIPGGRAAFERTIPVKRIGLPEEIASVAAFLPRTTVIADNGCGFDVDGVGGEGNGLPNMRRRLEDIGGRLEITSQPGKGTTVRLVVPREQLHGRVIGSAEHVI